MNRRTLILKTFKEIGLTSYEARSYLSLLERDTLTVAEVSKIAEIPRANAYEALEKLMAKGMCIAKPGETKRYTASDPASVEDKFLTQLDTATEVEIQNLKSQLRTKEKQILEKAETIKRNIGQMMKELRPQFEESRLETNPMEYIETIKDPYQMHKTFMRLLAGMKRELLICMKPPYSGPKERLEEQIEQETEPLQRGMRIRGIYEIPKDTEEIEWWFKSMDTAAKHGEECRVIKELPMKMAIFDEEIVMLTLEDPVSERTSLTTQIVQHRTLAKGLKILFETLWEQAEDYRACETLR
jgi:sugar-specific transcriptional regulator TrmB